MQVKQLLKKHLWSHHRTFAGAKSKGRLSLMQEPVESEVDSLLQQAGEYAPQSGQIFGILKQMKESFETNLVSAQDTEASAKDSFASMKASKTAEIKSATELIDSKTALKASTNEKNAAAKEDLMTQMPSWLQTLRFWQILKTNATLPLQITWHAQRLGMRRLRQSPKPWRFSLVTTPRTCF